MESAKLEETSGVDPLETLRRILSLERDLSYQDKAVIGGLDKLAAHWQGTVAREMNGPDHRQRLCEVLGRLRNYSDLRTREERASAVEEMLRILDDRALAPAPQPVSHPPERLSSVPPETASLDSPVTNLKGIGRDRAKRLSQLGVQTIRDLLFLFPRRYNDFQTMKPIYRLQYGEIATVAGTIWETKTRQGRGGQAIVTSIISDGTGTVQATWFNQPYLVQAFRAGRQVVISGRVDEYLGRLTFTSPEWEILTRELIHTHGLIPVYPLTEGISARWLRLQVKRVVDRWSSSLIDPLPPAARERGGVIPLSDAIQQIHFPGSQDALAQAQRRLAFDELFLMQLGVLQQRHQWRVRPGRPVPVGQQNLDRFVRSLPFALTEAQKRALQQILEDIQRPEPMNRLLQGDVGSGKTVVAVAAMLQAVSAGYQAVLMAPTEILAAQHAHTINRLLSHLGEGQPPVILLTGSLTAGEKEEVYRTIRDGSAGLVIGTHALIQQGVAFDHLALVVIDEQHRFGVAQRARLRQKGHNPHLLVMTATPIPRTLALTLYGDLDISVIDEMPPGRKPVTTRWLAPHERERAYQFLRNQVEQGHQGFIICPLVEESERIDARAAMEEHGRLAKKVFPDLRVGLLHGRMDAEAKDETMRRFVDQELDILVSTAVVEVGIDVPNATVMLIEGADRFGMSQLHQFRGRVGRGEASAYCLLLAESPTAEAEERLRAVEQSQDGFALAEKDLEIRGPGEFLGLRQSGLPAVGMAKLGDLSLLETAREEARKLFRTDPELGQPRHRLLRQQLLNRGWLGEGDPS